MVMSKRRSTTAVLSMDDILVQVLDRLPEPSDRKFCRLVSTAFYRAERLHRRSLRLFRIEALPILMGRYPVLERIDLSACPSVDDAVLAKLAVTAGAKVRAVGLSRTSGVGWRGLEALAAACPRLESVDLSHCVGVGDREAAALARAAGLRELRLDKCLGVTDVGLARVAVGCAKLERLGIKWCLEISDIGIDLLTKKCPILKDLDISYLKVTNRSLCSISSLGKLEVLSMVGCPYIDDEGLRFLNNGTNSLQSIDVSRCGNVSSSGLISLIEGHKCIQSLHAGDCFPELSSMFISKLSDLKATLITLKLDGFQASDAYLRTIGVNCKNLVEIGLSKCRRVTDEGLSELVSNCGNLRTVDLTCCHLITDVSLCAIASNCKKLACLRLECCSHITEKGLDRISSCCSYLQEIDLTDCSISDTALKCLSGCSELVVLKLGLCQNISSKGLAHVGSNCRKLQELDLYRCVGVTDDGLAAIASGCKKLKKLNICYCTGITDRGMKHVSLLAELCDLELRGLVHLTSDGISAIARGCRSLVELDLKRCYYVDDVGLTAIAHYTENLRQINVSYCSVSEVGLCRLLGGLRCLQNVKLVHLTRVTAEGFEIALRGLLSQLKKLKLLVGLRLLLSPLLIQMLQTRGCRIRWVNKPLKFG